MTYSCLCGHDFKRWQEYFDHWKKEHEVMITTGGNLLHVLEIQMAIEKCIAGETQHGSFVTYMAEKNYGKAATYADGTMQLVFCELVKWREWLDDEEVKARWKGKIHLYGKADAVHEDGPGRVS